MESLYTPQEQAVEIIGERQQDTRLITRVQEYLGGELPSTKLKIGQVSTYLARYLPDASKESMIFADEAKRSGFEQILWASYNEDKFVSANQEKAALIRPPINLPKNQRRRLKIVDQAGMEDKIGDIQTIYGYNLTEYYQGLREVVFSQNNCSQLVDDTFDMSSWYSKQALRFGWDGKSPNRAQYYYKAIMALVSVYAALYDVDNTATELKSNIKFTDDVMQQSADEVERTLGVKPVLVAIPGQEGLNDTDMQFLSDEEQQILIENGSKALAQSSSGILEVR